MLLFGRKDGMTVLLLPWPLSKAQLSVKPAGWGGSRWGYLVGGEKWVRDKDKK